MSEDQGIQLSESLIDDVVDAVSKHADGAKDNIGITLQYLGAVMGYLSAQFPGSEKERHDWLEQLNGFIIHVSDEHAEEKQQQSEINVQKPAAANTPSGKCEPDSDNSAAGVWRVAK